MKTLDLRQGKYAIRSFIGDFGDMVENGREIKPTLKRMYLIIINMYVHAAQYFILLHTYIVRVCMLVQFIQMNDLSMYYVCR